MRKLGIALLALGLVALAVPAMALDAAKWYTEEGGTSGPGGGPTRSNDCLGDIVWDTGMTDDFTPPTGCSSAGSAGCFVSAINDGGFPPDGRRMADDWISDVRPITGIKIWSRYSASGYDYHAQNPASLHGFCVKFYEPSNNGFCPDGTVDGETAIGNIVYDQYTTNFIEYEIPGYLPRNFNYCITLPVPFQPPQVGYEYQVSASADFDFTTFGTGVTQWFCRMYPGQFGGYTPYCEASWWDTWNTPSTPWIPISVGINLPCWAGWEMGFVLYSNVAPPVPGACCDPATGNCTLVMQTECLPPLVWNGNPSCTPNPCPPPVPVENSTWGALKHLYR